MRVLLLADVHTNWEALLALQRAESKPDAILFAGDAVGYGPDPVACARWLLANAATAVRGNHEEATIRPEGFSETLRVLPELTEATRETLQYARAVLTPHDHARLSQWPASATISLGGARFHLMHGHTLDVPGGRLNPATCPEAELRALFDDIPADVILLGHTHLPAIRQFGDRLIVNPGSLGQPRYGTPDATYAVWDDGHLQIKHLHYDHDATARRLRLAHLSPEVAEQLSEILETGLVA